MYLGGNKKKGGGVNFFFCAVFHFRYDYIIAICEHFNWFSIIDILCHCLILCKGHHYIIKSRFSFSLQTE